MKNVLKFGKALSNAELKQVNGGAFQNPCPCINNYDDHGNDDCLYQASRPGPLFRCLGTIQPNGMCCVN